MTAFGQVSTEKRASMVKKVAMAAALAGGITMSNSPASFAATAATTAIYSGGGVLASFAYRDLFDCWGSSSGGSLGLTTGSTCPTNGLNPDSEVLYDAAGTDGGQGAYLNDNPDRLQEPTPGYPPATSSDFPNFPYPRVDFANGGVPLTASQIATLNTAALGPAIQVPSLVMPVVIAFHAGGLDIVNAPPAGGSSGLRLTRDDVCGIFSGVIDDWSDARLSVDNGRQFLSTAPLQIKVVYRNDSSDTAYFLASALITQCADSAYPMPPAWGTASQTYFLSNATAGNLPANFYNEQALGGSGANGADGMTDVLSSTEGAIGFLPPEYAEPYGVPGHTPSPTANLQNQASISANIKRFFAPTPATTRAIVADLNAPVPGDNAATWGAKGVAANPDVDNAYPIGGFSWLYVYSCYSNSTILKSLIGSGDQGLLRWLYGTDPNVAEILHNHGFAVIPVSWLQATRALLFTATATKIRHGGGANAGFCSTGE